jgi:hypothetical protein
MSDQPKKRKKKVLTFGERKHLSKYPKERVDHTKEKKD